jgi:hypothetical protein
MCWVAGTLRAHVHIYNHFEHIPCSTVPAAHATSAACGRTSGKPCAVESWRSHLVLALFAHVANRRRLTCLPSKVCHVRRVVHRDGTRQQKTLPKRSRRPCPSLLGPRPEHRDQQHVDRRQVWLGSEFVYFTQMSVRCCSCHSPPAQPTTGGSQQQYTPTNLNHEALDVPVEPGAVVVPTGCQRQEVVRRFGREIAVQLHLDVPQGCVQCCRHFLFSLV